MQSDTFENGNLAEWSVRTPISVRLSPAPPRILLSRFHPSIPIHRRRYVQVVFMLMARVQIPQLSIFLFLYLGFHPNIIEMAVKQGLTESLCEHVPRPREWLVLHRPC
jgi:hypothetical protein